jgi:hypothetical protein
LAERGCLTRSGLKASGRFEVYYAATGNMGVLRLGQPRSANGRGRDARGRAKQFPLFDDEHFDGRQCLRIILQPEHEADFAISRYGLNYSQKRCNLAGKLVRKPPRR